ncbi:MAG TPA: amidohydrolase family protein [Pseudolabrys sp.]|jgi:aminocarboxymuconate-semialdehyde decarboxylase
MVDTIIDIYCHIYPDRFFQEMMKAAPKLGNIGPRLRSITKLFDLDARFREMDTFGDYRQIISLPNPPIEDIAKPDAGMHLARIANDDMAELCRKHPRRFPTFAAALCLTDVDGSIKEARRAVKELGAAGVLVYTSIASEPLDEPKFEPFFAAIAELDATIWLHPERTAALPDYLGEKKSRYEMWWCLGWPYDTSVAMIRMVFCGLFDRHPNLRIITHHLGGMIPFYDGRVGPGLKVLGARTSDEDYWKILPSLKRPHMDYLREYYADTAMFGGGAHALRCGLEFFGADHVVFATDAPLGPIAPTTEAIKKLELAPADQHKLFCGNAEKLLKMKF